MSVGLDDFHSIVFWDWKKGEKIATTRYEAARVLQHPADDHTSVNVNSLPSLVRFHLQTQMKFTS